MTTNSFSQVLIYSLHLFDSADFKLSTARKEKIPKCDEPENAKKFAKYPKDDVKTEVIYITASEKSHLYTMIAICMLHPKAFQYRLLSIPSLAGFVRK